MPVPYMYLVWSPYSNRTFEQITLVLGQIINTIAYALCFTASLGSETLPDLLAAHAMSCPWFGHLSLQYEVNTLSGSLFDDWYPTLVFSSSQKHVWKYCIIVFFHFSSVLIKITVLFPLILHSLRYVPRAGYIIILGSQSRFGVSFHMIIITSPISSTCINAERCWTCMVKHPRELVTLVYWMKNVHKMWSLISSTNRSSYEPIFLYHVIIGITHDWVYVVEINPLVCCLAAMRSLDAWHRNHTAWQDNTPVAPFTNMV